MAEIHLSKDRATDGPIPGQNSDDQGALFRNILAEFDLV